MFYYLRLLSTTRTLRVDDRINLVSVSLEEQFLYKCSYGSTLATEGYRLVLGENPQPCLVSPASEWHDGQSAWWLRNVYWRRERAHDKTEERVVCTAGAFIGCVDNVKSEQVTQGEEMTKV